MRMKWLPFILMCKTCMCSDMQREEMVDQLNTWAVKEEIPMKELDFLLS